MTSTDPLSPALGSPPTAATRRRLAEALDPGRRRLEVAGVAQCAAAAATVAGFFAVAAIAQDVLGRRAGWPRDRGWLLLLAGSATARAVASYLAARLATRGALCVEDRLRARLLHRLIGGTGSSLPSAGQATAVMDEVERVGAYAERYEPARIAAVLVPVVLLAVVFPENWLIGVLLLLCLPLAPVNLSIVGMGAATMAGRHAEELRQLNNHFRDRLRGMATLRALGADRAELARVKQASERLAERAMAVLRVAFVSAAVLEAIVTVSVAIVAIYVGLTLLGYVQVPGLPSHMSLRTGLFLLMVTPLYFQPVRTLAAAYHERAGALAATEALTPLLEARSVGTVRPAGRRLTQPPTILIADLTVSFAGRERPALDHVSLRVDRGELVGLTGSSGAGKSTLLRVIVRDLEPSSGHVLLDGAPGDDIAQTGIIWLGQRPYLFPGTLADNIALGRPDTPEAEIVEAALAAGLARVLRRLPLGLDTPVGEGGWGLSGGEAHRIGLARAFLRSAHLLVLDEPTAHLDAASEAEIIEVLHRLARRSTTIVASHSPALLAACDRVITFDRGRVLDAAHWEVAEAVA